MPLGDHYKIYTKFFNAPDKCFSAKEKTPKIKYFITNLTLGFPLVPPKLSKVDEDKPAKDHKYPGDNETAIAFLKDVISHMDTKFPISDTGVKLRVDGFILAIDDFLALVISDLLKAVFSVTFVFLYLNFHLQSCFLACLGMGIIVFSFPFTVIITHGIF